MWSLLLALLMWWGHPGQPPKETIWVTRIELHHIVGQLRQSPRTKELAFALHKQLFDNEQFWVCCNTHAYLTWREEIRINAQGAK